MQKRPKPSGKEYLLAGVLSLVLVWLVFLNYSIASKEEIARHAAHDTQAQLSSLDTRQGALEADMNELSTERGQEATLRETYGVVRPGEGVIIVLPSQRATSTPPVPWYQKWFGWLLFWEKPVATTSAATGVTVQ